MPARPNAPLLAILVFCAGITSSLAAPYISEFLADNVTDLKDLDGDEPDWIEIHNPDASSVELANWSLTDDPELEAKWFFPAITLSPGQRLIVFASGKNRRDPSSELHTNFSLRAKGEYLALLNSTGSPVSEFSPEFPEQIPDVSYGRAASTELLVTPETGLSYHIPSSAIGSSWREIGFTDPSGLFVSTDGGTPLHPGIGYDTSGEYVPLIGTSLPSGTTTAYARLPFLVEDPAALEGLTLDIQYDDAFVAWLNGHEVARSSGAPSNPDWDSRSSANHEADLNEPESYDLSAHLGNLEAGDNLLAIQVLNRSSSSSDLIANPYLHASGASSGTNYLSTTSPGKANGEGFVPGPRIEEAKHLPALPGDDDPIVVSCKVAPRLGTISQVELIYRVNYGTETTLPMTGDADGNFSATIPAAAATLGEMLRWKIVARDSLANESRSPAFLDRTGTNQSPEYFGTVIGSPALPEALPTYHWFTQNEGNSRNRTGTRASFFFDGEFHDNIYVRQRGGYTNNGSQKFDFNSGDSFEYDAEVPAIGEVNLNGRGSDSSYMRQPIAFDAIREAACPSSISFPVQLRLNGNFDRVAIHIEQVDADFLKRQGLPEGGALYKFVQRSNLRPALNDTDTGTEKKTRQNEDFSDLNALIAGLKQSQAGSNIENSGSLIHTQEETAARELFLFDHLNIPQIVNYLAAHVIIQDTDDTRKNFYLYRDSEKSGEWYMFPWDKDFTFGVGESASSLAKHPFWGDAQHKNPNANQWSILFDAIHNNPRMRSMILRRTRTLLDQLYTNSASNPDAFFEPEAQRLEALIDPVLNVNGSSLVAEFNERRRDLYNLFGPSGSDPLLPAAQSTSLPLEFGTIDHNPSSANQDQEYIELINPNSEDLDLSGWILTGGARFAFGAGTVLPAGESIYLSPSPAAFRQRSTAPSGQQGRLVVGPYSGKLSSFGETLTISDSAGTPVISTSYEGDPSPSQLHLVVSEIHYHPAGDPAAEFIELLNTSDTLTLDLTGVKFIAGIDFDFTSSSVTSLAPGERTLVVRDLAAFEATYGTDPAMRVAGAFANGTSLSNGGERIKLDDATNSTIRDFSYSDTDPWPSEADGGGPSLVLQAPFQVPDHNDPANWSSGIHSGTPGKDEPTPFAAWLAARGQSDPMADPDGDGWSELETFVLAGDLLPRPAPLEISNTIDGPTLRYIHREGSAAGISLEISYNLSDWAEGIDGIDFETLPSLAGEDATRSVELKILPREADSSRAFYRLKITLDEP